MTDMTPAQQMAAGLRALAALVDEHPDMAGDIDHTLNSLLGMPMFNDNVTDQRARLVEWARAGKQHGAKITKDADSDDDFKLVVDFFGAVRIRILADREKVCEKVVTGTEVVTKKVKDPALLAEVPEIEVTETVETVKWRCSSLLADTAVSS